MPFQPDRQINGFSSKYDILSINTIIYIINSDYLFVCLSRTVDQTGMVLGETGMVLGETGRVLGETGRVLGETGRLLGETGRVLGETGRVLAAR